MDVLIAISVATVATLLLGVMYYVLQIIARNGYMHLKQLSPGRTRKLFVFNHILFLPLYALLLLGVVWAASSVLCFLHIPYLCSIAFLLPIWLLILGPLAAVGGLLGLGVLWFRHRQEQQETNRASRKL